METVWSLKIDEVLKVGVNLNELGVNNWALNKSEALVVLDKLTKLGVSVLGGDVYEESQGIIQPNYDSWYCDELLEESKEEYVRRSIKEARSYIEKYNFRNAENIFFVFVPGV